MVMDEFENSVPMSTYLMAFLVSDFDYTGSFAYRVSRHYLNQPCFTEGEPAFFLNKIRLKWRGMKLLITANLTSRF